MLFEDYCQIFESGLAMADRKASKDKWAKLVRQIMLQIAPDHRPLATKIAGFLFGKGQRFGLKHLQEGQHGSFSPFWVDIKRPEAWFAIGITFAMVCDSLQKGNSHDDTI